MSVLVSDVNEVLSSVVFLAREANFSVFSRDDDYVIINYELRTISSTSEASISNHAVFFCVSVNFNFSHFRGNERTVVVNAQKILDETDQHVKGINVEELYKLK